MDPTLGASALALIGLFNVFGSYLFGWLGGRYSKRVLLGGIYVLRSLFITAYFVMPPTETSTLIFAAAMGTLWLGVVPLVVAQGAGSEMRQSLGIAVFAGMIGVTIFGLLFTPTFYVVCRWFSSKFQRKPVAPEPLPAPEV